MTFINFQAVKDATKIADVADALGYSLKEKAGQLRGECIVCEKGGERAFCVTPAKSRFYCFGCQSGGDAIQLVAVTQGVHPKEAAKWIVDTFNLNIGTDPEESKKTTQRPKPATKRNPASKATTTTTPNP